MKTHHSAAEVLKRFKAFLTKERHLKLPYLDFYLRIPLLTIRTDLWHEAVERMTYDYIGVYIKFYKWEWKFKLYQPDFKREG